MRAFSTRCAKEILRDRLNLIFGLGFPIVILLLLSAIRSNTPVTLYEIENLTPGICIFGLSFMTLFSATLIAKDRESAFLQRLYTTPLKAHEYILGYMLPMLPIAVLQTIVCYGLSFLLGLSPSVNIFFAVLLILPISIFYISLGLLCGSVCNVKQVGGLCGALLTNLSAWLSGTWFALDLLGKSFGKFAKILPFFHAVEAEKSMLHGDVQAALSHLSIVLIYALVVTLSAVALFLRQKKRQ